MPFSVNRGAISVTSSQVLGYVMTPAARKAVALHTKGLELISIGAPNSLSPAVTACATLGSNVFLRSCPR